MSELKQKVEFGMYQFSITQDFVSLPVPAVPPKVEIGTWIAKSTGAGFGINVYSGQQSVSDAKKNMRQVLVDTSRGIHGRRRIEDHQTWTYREW